MDGKQKARAMRRFTRFTNAFSKKLSHLVRAEPRQDIILLKVDQQKQWPRLIGSGFTAAIGVVLTGYVAALTLRAALWQSPHHFHWLLPVGTFLPARATLAVNVALYAWLL